MTDLLLRGGTLINEGNGTEQDILVRNGRIKNIGPALSPASNCKDWMFPENGSSMD